MNSLIKFEIKKTDTAAEHPDVQSFEDAPSGLLYAYVPQGRARDFVNETDADASVLTEYVESLLTDDDVIADNIAETTDHLDTLREAFGPFEICGFDTTLEVKLI